MSKSLYIAEKPSVAREFANALKLNMRKYDGYMESDAAIVTWCVGHLVTMSYPDVYDQKYKKWSFHTLPFLPVKYKYEVIPSAKKQYEIVRQLLTREDVDTIYVCTDSGREGEYIYRLVEMQANVKDKQRRRVWIDSQTEEEILRGIKEAKDLSEYDNLSEAAYLRAKEDYLMGINFSRALTLKYGDSISGFLNMKYAVISVGRVMTCVLGMIVKREREIRAFTKTPFYRVISRLSIPQFENDGGFEAEWRAVEASKYFNSPLLYKENGFKEEKDANDLVEILKTADPYEAVILNIERKKENKKPPLLYNLAELQNECSKLFKISPDETLRIVQELYEKKAVTYPRTDARVLSTAVSKEITKNIKGLCAYLPVSQWADEILKNNLYKDLAKSRYVNDKQITDHYAIIPTGQGIDNIRSVSETASKVYEVIARRFLSIFFPAAVYQKTSLTAQIQNEQFFASFKTMLDEGYLKVATLSFSKKAREAAEAKEAMDLKEADDEEEDSVQKCDAAFIQELLKLKKHDKLSIEDIFLKEGETSPPKRYSSGSLILAMENAGQLIEDDELRAQIKGSGIGTSATRAEILKKLVTNQYLALNKKTQIITPTLMGEMIYDVVDASIKPLLNPELTASWEKGLMGVAEGSISPEEYMEKLNGYVARRTDAVRNLQNQSELRNKFREAASCYKPAKQKSK